MQIQAGPGPITQRAVHSDDVLSVPKSFPEKVSKEARQPLPEAVNPNLAEKPTSDDSSDAIPLYDSSPVFVSKGALAKAYIPMPAIYASRVTDLVIGKETLMRIAQGKEQPDKSLLHAIITHVCQVFAIRGDKLKASTVQEFIDHKLSTLKAVAAKNAKN